MRTHPETGRRHRRRAALLLEPDHYVAVFCLIILALILLGASSEWRGARLLVTAVLSGNIIYAMRVSGVRPRLLRLSGVLVVLALILSIAAYFGGSTELGLRVDTTLAAVLVFVTPIVIARRLAQHVAVTIETITGALSIYLLLGMLFAFVYRFLATVHSGPIFVQNAHPSVVDFVYFSFVTMTTLGYGDLSPATDIMRMLSVTEALLGQFYLVTVVALLVAHASVSRNRRDAQ